MISFKFFGILEKKKKEQIEKKKNKRTKIRENGFKRIEIRKKKVKKNMSKKKISFIGISTNEIDKKTK